MTCTTERGHHCPECCDECAETLAEMASVEPEPWHPYEQSDPAVNGCDHCGEDRRLHP